MKYIFGFKYNLSLGMLLTIFLTVARADLPMTMAERDLGQMQKIAFAPLIARAHEMDIKIYLMGSSAAFLVKLASLGRAPNDKNFTDIFSIGQDFDMFIEGSRSSVEKFTTWAQEKFPDYEWDAESINRIDRHTQEHSDSSSTTIFELTDNLTNWRVRDFTGRTGLAGSPFFKNLSEGKLQFYFDENHGQSYWQQRGKNPAIFAALRYLINLSRWSLAPEESSIPTVKKIIDDFDPSRDLTTPYATKRFLQLIEKLKKYPYFSDWTQNLNQHIQQQNSCPLVFK